MRPHVKVVAALFFALGLVLIAGALFSSVFFGILATAAGASSEDGGQSAAALFGLTGAALTALALGTAAPVLACGWGLLKTRRWARILAIIVGAFCLIDFPVGSLFGVYVLWVMFNKKTETLFVV